MSTFVAPQHIDLFDQAGFRKWLAEAKATIYDSTVSHEVVRYCLSGPKDGKLHATISRRANGRLTYAGRSEKHYRTFMAGVPYDDHVAVQRTVIGAQAMQVLKKTKRKRLTNPGSMHELLWARDGDKCFYCDCQMTPFRPNIMAHVTRPAYEATLEHLVPLSTIQHGTNDPENFVLCCAPCNAIMGDRPLYEKIRIRDELQAFLLTYEGTLMWPDFVFYMNERGLDLDGSIFDQFDA